MAVKKFFRILAGVDQNDGAFWQNLGDSWQNLASENATAFAKKNAKKSCKFIKELFPKHNNPLKLAKMLPEQKK